LAKAFLAKSVNLLQQDIQETTDHAIATYKEFKTLLDNAGYDNLEAAQEFAKDATVYSADVLSSAAVAFVAGAYSAYKYFYGEDATHEVKSETCHQ
jgi:hypothetical protein